jgi:hypothetical protein
LTKCIGQINHYSQVDWTKNTCFELLVKMGMSINKKRPISQLELFEKPCFVIMTCIIQLKNIVLNFMLITLPSIGSIIPMEC